MPIKNGHEWAASPSVLSPAAKPLPACRPPRDGNWENAGVDRCHAKGLWSWEPFAEFGSENIGPVYVEQRLHSSHDVQTLGSKCRSAQISSNSPSPMSGAESALAPPSTSRNLLMNTRTELLPPLPHLRPPVSSHQEILHLVSSPFPETPPLPLHPQRSLKLPSSGAPHSPAR